MASFLAHAVVGATIGVPFRRPGMPKRYWILGALCAMLPDLDIVFWGVQGTGASVLAHRGLTHSLLFGIFAGVLIARFAFPGEAWQVQRRRIQVYFATSMASHGVVDSFTIYGDGVALFAPVQGQRVVSAFRPLGAVDLSELSTFSSRVVALAVNEILWIGVPCAALLIATYLFKRIWPRHL